MLSPSRSICSFRESSPFRRHGHSAHSRIVPGSILPVSLPLPPPSPHPPLGSLAIIYLFFFFIIIQFFDHFWLIKLMARVVDGAAWRRMGSQFGNFEAGYLKQPKQICLGGGGRLATQSVKLLMRAATHGPEQTWKEVTPPQKKRKNKKEGRNCKGNMKKS